MPTPTSYERFFDAGGTNHFTGLSTGYTKPDHDTLKNEVDKKLEIVPGLTSIKIVSSAKCVMLTFKDALSAGEETHLENVCAAHTGVPEDDPDSIRASDGRLLVANHQIPVRSNPYWYSRGDNFANGTRLDGAKCYAKLDENTPQKTVKLELIDPLWMLGGALDIINGEEEDDYISMSLMCRATPIPARRTATDGNCNLYSMLDSGGGAWQGDVIDKDLTVPPGSPTSGDRYIVGASATGDWATHDDEIAEWNGSSWDFSSASDGWHSYVTDETTIYRFASGAWAAHPYFMVIPAPGNGLYELDFDENHPNLDADPLRGLLRVPKASPFPVGSKTNPDGWWDYDAWTTTFAANYDNEGKYFLFTFEKMMMQYVNEWRMKEYSFQSPSDTRLFLPHWFMSTECNRDSSHADGVFVRMQFGYLAGRLRTD